MPEVKHLINDISIELQVSVRIKQNIDALLTLQTPTGAIDARCDSRILESSLALYLLRSQAYGLERQEQIVQYLQKEIGNKKEYTTPLENVIITMAERLVNVDQISNTISQQGTTSIISADRGRKALYFGCLLAETGVIDFSDLPFDFISFQTPHQAVQTWANVMLCSLKVMYCYGTSNEHLITLEDRNFLTSKLFQTAIFENNVLTQIVGLIALSKLLPSEQLENPINALLTWQQADGGFPLMTGLDNFVTPLAGFALLESLPYLIELDQVTSNAALRNMANYLASEQKESGGWSYMKGTAQIDLDDTGLCHAFLAVLDPTAFNTHINKAESYVAQMQHSDGGYPTYINGNPSTTSMTAAVLHGILEMVSSHPEKISSWRNSIAQTLQYLARNQKDNGTFEKRWSRSETHAMFRVAVVLRIIQQNRDLSDLDELIQNILDKIDHYLTNSQNADGGWGFNSDRESDHISTAYAILCCSLSKQELAKKGVHFLLKVQENNSTHTKPDLLGPRPVPYSIPSLHLVIQIYAFAYFMKIHKST